LPNPATEKSTTDELSKWKPSINKSRLVSSNKTTIQNDVNIETTIENEDNTLNGKRKIDESDNNNEESAGKNKRNKLQQFACNR